VREETRVIVRLECSSGRCWIHRGPAGVRRTGPEAYSLRVTGPARARNPGPFLCVRPLGSGDTMYRGAKKCAWLATRDEFPSTYRSTLVPSSGNWFAAFLLVPLFWSSALTPLSAQLRPSLDLRGGAAVPWEMDQAGAFAPG